VTQLPLEMARFTLVNHADRDRELTVESAPTGLRLTTHHDHGVRTTSFPPGDEKAAADRIVSGLRAAGANDPMEDLGVRDAHCPGEEGLLLLFGIGVNRA
jgi:hypothetical protein